MGDLLPPATLADVLAALAPPIDRAGAHWSALCAALDAYDRVAASGLDLEEARHQVDKVAMTLETLDGIPAPRLCPPLPRDSHMPARRWSRAAPCNPRPCATRRQRRNRGTPERFRRAPTPSVNAATPASHAAANSVPRRRSRDNAASPQPPATARPSNQLSSRKDHEHAP